MRERIPAVISCTASIAAERGRVHRIEELHLQIDKPRNFSPRGQVRGNLQCDWHDWTLCMDGEDGRTLLEASGRLPSTLRSPSGKSTRTRFWRRP